MLPRAVYVFEKWQVNGMCTVVCVSPDTNLHFLFYNSPFYGKMNMISLFYKNTAPHKMTEEGSGPWMFGRSFVFLTLASIVLLLFGVLCREPATETVYPVCFQERVLIIDAGHGGEDGGAVSLTGALESHINLAVAKRLDRVLGLFGVPVIMMREDDISLHDQEAKTLRQKKNSDLHHRVNVVREQTHAILLSIHQNSYPDGRYRGAQVFYAPTNGSRELAQTMQESLRMFLSVDNNRQEKQIPNTIFLMNNVSCPAVLVECGFLTNPAEEQLLRSSHYQTKLAVALAGGYLRCVT